MLSRNLKLKYISFYNDNSFNSNENRNTNLAINNKIKYICSALTKNGYEVEIISACWSNNKRGYYRGKVYNLFDKVTLRNFATFGSINILGKKAKQIFAVFQLLLFLIVNTKKHEKILVYHSLALMLPIQLAKFIKKLNIILEVEEVYTDVWKSKTSISSEVNYINKADKYILVSDVLKKMFNHKPSIVLYGSYKVLDDRPTNNSDKSLIDIVYAGSIDAVKGGARNAILCTEFLPDNFRMHILGFGEEQAIDVLLQDIKSINDKKGIEVCRYYGSMIDDDYMNFLLNCDIGVNPQYKGEYMDTAFPSKVLSYLEHNLKVVSTEINSIKLSKIAPFVTFAENDEPKSIAKAIIAASCKEYINDNNLIRNLDKAFIKSLKCLLGG